MTALFLALLRILFPLDVVARMRELTRRFVAEVHAISQDPAKLADLANTPEARAWFEGRIAFTEEAIQLLIHERARQILGLPYIYTRRNRDCPPHCSRPLPELLKRLERLITLHAKIERLAHRRAEHMRLEMADNPLAACPLRLRTACATTSLALRAMEANHRVASLSAMHWRRWIATSLSRDGEARSAGRIGPSDQFERRTPEATAQHRHARGPPLNPLDCPLLTANCLSRFAAEIAPAHPQTKRPPSRAAFELF